MRRELPLERRMRRLREQEEAFWRVSWLLIGAGLGWPLMLLTVMLLVVGA